MLVTTLSVGPIGTNCYVVGCEETLEGMIVDPGGNAERILAAVEEMGLMTRYVVNTHAHFDHVTANRELVEVTGAVLVLHPDEVPILKMGGEAQWFGFPADPSPDPGLLVCERDTLPVGQLSFRIMHEEVDGLGIAHRNRYLKPTLEKSARDQELTGHSGKLRVCTCSLFLVRHIFPF